jgi:hypothetical protein
VLVEELVHPGEERGEPALGCERRGGGHDAAVERGEAGAAARDDAEAGVGEARVDAEDDHPR